MMSDPSPAYLLAVNLVNSFGKEGAHAAAKALLDKLTVTQRAALVARWETWARSKQLPPPGLWRSWGFLTGRGFGKTQAVAAYVNGEALAGRAKCIGLAAQNEAKTISSNVRALIDTAPPWAKPEWLASEKRLVWPSGAEAWALTPEVPSSPRSFNFDMVWLSELQSWPAGQMLEAWSNFAYATRVGKARTIWDSTPKARHPILKSLLARAARDPEYHSIVRGSMRENSANLAPGVLEDAEREYGGTQKGREEIDGEMLEETENALFKSAWIEASRRPLPETLTRRVVSVDPAITARIKNDRTGIVEVGLGADGQAYVIGDYSGRYRPEEWAAVVIDKYVAGRCDLAVVERNKGGDLLLANLRAIAKDRDQQIVVVGKDEKPRHARGVVHVKEINTDGSKADRAQPTATAYERGRVSHVRGVDLDDLEGVLTTWEPTPGSRSPDAMDALVHAVAEVLDLSTSAVDHRRGFAGLVGLSQALRAPGLGALLGGGDRSGRI